jgi:hypothetical protein
MSGSPLWLEVLTVLSNRRDLSGSSTGFIFVTVIVTLIGVHNQSPQPRIVARAIAPRFPWIVNTAVPPSQHSRLGTRQAHGAASVGDTSILRLPTRGKWPPGIPLWYNRR